MTDANNGYKMRKQITYKLSTANATGIALLLWFCCFSFKGSAQAFSYTQYMNNLTPINSAYPLMDNDGTVNMLARRQWVGVNGAPTTLFFNGNFPIENINASAGLIVLNDKLGVENQTSINAFFAKAVQLSEGQFLAVSLNFGLRHYTANYSQLDPTDNALGPDITEMKPNVGFGVLFYSKQYYVGLSVPQFTIRSLGTGSVTTDNNFFRNNYYITGGITADVADGIKIKPATLVSYTRGVPVIADFSTIFLFKDTFGIGANYRTNSETALILSTDFLFFHVGYSYQFGTSSSTLGGYSNSTQEITLGYRFGRRGLNIYKADKERQFGY